MVMIVFKPQNCNQADIILSHHNNFETYGQQLWQQYAYKKEQITLNAQNLSVTDICNIAFGALVSDYYFDKYNTKKKEDYPLLETIIFYTAKHTEAYKEFEAYAALANAIRFAKDLYNEPTGTYQTEQYFFEIKRLEYLGLSFKDCGNNLLRLIWKGSDTNKEQTIIAPNKQTSAITAGIIKAIALQKLHLNLVAYLKIENTINDLLVNNPIYINNKINNEQDVEIELRRVYNLIKENKHA